MKVESTVSPEDLRETLQSALGQERASAAVRDASAALGLQGLNLTRPQALEVLGKIAETDGLVGISARFARSRLMSRWAADQLADFRNAESASNDADALDLEVAPLGERGRDREVRR